MSAAASATAAIPAIGNDVFAQRGVTAFLAEYDSYLEDEVLKVQYQIAYINDLGLGSAFLNSLGVGGDSLDNLEIMETWLNAAHNALVAV